MQKINNNLEKDIIELLKKGRSSRQTAEKFKISKSTVNNVRERNKVVAEKKTKGRPRMISDGDARLIERAMHSKETKTPKLAAKSINLNVSEWTTRRALKRLGLTASIKKKKPALSAKNIKQRLAFSKEHKHWTADDWKRVIWSNETKINRFQSDGKEYYWHRPNESLQQHQVKQTMKHGGGNLMVWACFTWWHIGPLVKIDGIMCKEDYLRILQAHLPEFVDECAYGDPKHTAKIVQNWLSSQKFKTLK